MKIMKTLDAKRSALLLGICLFGASFAAVGCQNTAEGAKQDAQNTGAAVENAADKAATATKEATGNAGDALSLTPKVKAAIVADASLNDTKNLIDVDTKDNVVYLKGHVQTNDEKKKATAIAEKTVKDAGSTDTVMNQLTVETH